MHVLVINCGSSSIKFQLYAMPVEDVLARGLVERIGEETGRLQLTDAAGSRAVEQPIADHAAGLDLVLRELQAGGVDLEAIGAVGHRVVHAGEAFAETVRITADVEAALEAYVPLAPLHNPANLLGIQVARAALPGALQVGVFDTAFHQTMPEVAYTYALPRSLYQDHGVRRYGFHGTSHRFVTLRAAEVLRRPVGEVNLITCHLGNGASMAAVRGGRSVDTTMGLTPLEGLVMGTRSGDIDPALPTFLQRTLGLDPDGVDRLLNKESGLKGLSGLGNDVRVLEEAAASGHAGAQLALDVTAYRLRKTIGAYTAVLGRVDALVFTAGIGENSARMRETALAGLEPLGYRLDPERNASVRGREADLTHPDGRVRILVVPTDEELMIARDTFALA